MSLRPELEQPPPRDRRVLIACSGGMVALTGAAIAFVSVHRAPAATVIAAPAPMLLPVPVRVLQPPRIEVITPDPEPPPENDLGTSELSRFVFAWLTDPDAPAPAIEYRRGVVYIESEEDSGDDRPPPRSTDAEAQRVCGSAAVWLRDHLRDRLSHVGLRCGDDACTYDGEEYMPNGTLAFRRTTRDGQPVWALVAWTQTYTAVLGRDEVHANLAFVAGATRRLAKTTCPGEPAGAY